MLNILKGVKLAQDDSTGDVYAVDCYGGPKKLAGGPSGGGSSSGSGGSSSGSGGVGVLIVNITNSPEDGSLVADKTVAEIIAAAHTQLVFAQYSVADTSGNGTQRVIAGPLARIQTATVNGKEMVALFFAGYWYDSKESAFVGGIMCMSENGVERWSYYA